MNLAFFASFIALILAVSISVRRQAKLTKERENAFWAREERSNNVRRKSLEHLDYISVPLERFPTHLLNDHSDVLECINILEDLSSAKIVNLTGYSNTDLKLEYGTANITLLSEYDQNFTVLIRTLQKWADLLWANHYSKEAADIMEYAVHIGTDIGKSYYLLAEYWVAEGKASHVDYLVKAAENLKSSHKEIIIRNLREKYPDVF